MVKKITVAISQQTHNALLARQPFAGSYSAAMEESLSRYFEMTRRERAKFSFTKTQWAALRASIGGQRFTATTLPLLTAWLTADPANLDETLIEKVRLLSYSGLCALLDDLDAQP